MTEKQNIFYEDRRQFFPGERLEIFGRAGHAVFYNWSYDFAHIMGRSSDFLKLGTKIRKKKYRGKLKVERSLFSLDSEVKS